jgi:hypothetical protein
LASLPPSALHPVAELAATAFGSLDEAIDAVLTLARDILGMGTVFISSADREAGCLRIVAVREGENACGLESGTEVPFQDTV